LQHVPEDTLTRLAELEEREAARRAAIAARRPHLARAGRISAALRLAALEDQADPDRQLTPAARRAAAGRLWADVMNAARRARRQQAGA
jgi:hypothetical protein